MCVCVCVCVCVYIHSLNVGASEIHISMLNPIF